MNWVTGLGQEDLLGADAAREGSRRPSQASEGHGRGSVTWFPTASAAGQRALRPSSHTVELELARFVGDLRVS